MIKQSSLGDVLHSTAAMAAIKQQYPDSKLTVLTNCNSAQVLASNSHIDELIQFDYLTIKQNGLRGLSGALNEMMRVIKLVRRQEFDLAFDLQGLFRSVLFLYFARAKQKFVKGRWLGLQGFKNKQLHALEEISQVLQLANIKPGYAMSLNSSEEDMRSLDKVLAAHYLLTESGVVSKPMIVISPFTRWPSKNWPLAHFIELAKQLATIQNQRFQVVITGTLVDKPMISQTMDLQKTQVVNLAGELNLTELAELMRLSALVVSGDSFPMHLASAVNTPLLALFGPTDEQKTGPLAASAKVLRAVDCNKCDLPNCPRQCLSNLPVDTVLNQAKSLLLNHR